MALIVCKDLFNANVFLLLKHKLFIKMVVNIYNLFFK